jgi:hypothetical protein
MTSSDQPFKLPLWLYYVTDAGFLGAGFLIARYAAHPLSPAAIFCITGCVIAGGIVLLIPLVVHFERQKNEMLDERQRALEALARTVGASAEQISIATSGLHEIVDIAQKNLRHAEQLPHKLHEKIAEFQALTTDAAETEKDELEKELIALRTSESERLEAISNKIARTAAEMAKLEAASQQHLATATEAAKGLGEAAGNATRAIESAKSAALAELDAKLASASAAFAERVSRDLIAKLQGVGGVTAAAEKTPADETAPASEDSPKAESTAHPPKRPRKPRRDDTAAEPATAESTAAQVEGTVAVAAEEPKPLPIEKIPEVAPIAPHTVDPFANPATSAPASAAVSSPAVEAVPTAEPTAVAEPARVPKKRAPKKSEPVAVTPEPSKISETEAKDDLRLIDDVSGPAASVAERVLTSDGATRLLVTAYIGIGNRLFIRGEGPGLSWEKGIPLQFVSIGKWRWETNDATAAVKFKIYKNDEAECTALGTQAVDPGYQQEVTAGF